MANVLFKRGLQATLDNASFTPEDGVFYLTTDSRRLYVGQQNGSNTELHLLNQTVQIVNNIASLPSTGMHVNDFYYCTDENVLCVWKEKANGTNAYGWHQINKNTDTTINGLEFTVAASNNNAAITQTINQTDGTNATSTSATYNIKGAGGINVTKENSADVVLTGNEYSVSRSVSNNIATVTLSSTNLPSTTSGFELKAGSKINLEATGTNQIAISAVDTVIDGVDLSVSNGALTFEVTSSDGSSSSSTSATLSNVGIAAGASTGNVGAYYLPLTNTSGKTAANIYTAEEIDNLIKGLDGMTYRGTIASAATVATVHALPTENVRRGDVYVVSDNGLTTSDVGNVTEISGELANGIRIGDMFIATGTENTATGYITTPQWTFVPSGNDSSDQFTYSANATTASNMIALNNQVPNAPSIMSIQLAASTGIDIASTSVNGNDLTATISHATVNTTSTTSTAASTSAISAVSSLTIDNGHVTGYNVETFTLSEYSFVDSRASSLINSDVANGVRMATATNAGPNDISFAINLAKDENPISSSVVKISSNTIKLSKGTDGEIVMNYEWGTF